MLALTATSVARAVTMFMCKVVVAKRTVAWSHDCVDYGNVEYSDGGGDSRGW